ncbi:hypothetical protein [Hafnia alvei]|nr:hypothetical protein [Hafnia alvei]
MNLIAWGKFIGDKSVRGCAQRDKDRKGVAKGICGEIRKEGNKKAPLDW